MIPQKPAGAEEETVPDQKQTTAGLGEHKGLTAQLKITLCKAGTKAHGDHGLRKGTKQALGLYWDGEMWETAAELPQDLGSLALLRDLQEQHHSLH